ncbi:hypothetical protein CPEBRM1_ABPJDJAI_01501 [Companilactobacillus paralimentarius]
MKKILILGANGKIARIVEKDLLNNPKYHLTLVLRNARRLFKFENAKNITLIDGDVDDRNLLNKVMSDQDIIYANLNGNMERHAKNIVELMQKITLKI